ncbi:putative nuclease HARBI1 [Pyxicephalus adspersus]|uniref:putative nuclease HARBI1 n=1 Tax=Pyxicephalus adspersus TaxID=30357 RepID=UPI003B599F8B
MAEPLPSFVDGEEEFDVERILDSQRRANSTSHRQIQILQRPHRRLAIPQDVEEEETSWGRKTPSGRRQLRRRRCLCHPQLLQRPCHQHLLHRTQVPHLNVADKGYRQLPWLMTAVRHPSSEAEHNYNKALQKSRGVVEQTIELLKARFLCLARPGGELLYAPWKAAQVIMACCVLHNPCLNRGDSWDIPEELEPEVHQHPASGSQSTAEGRRVRAELIANVFTRQ